MAASRGRRLADTPEAWERLGIRGWIALVVIVATLAWTGWYFYVRHDVPGLADARDRWNESGYDSYELRYSISGQVGSMPATVIVRDGEVESVEWADRVSERGPDGWTVEDLFDVIDDRATESVTFHSVTGQPIDVLFDPFDGDDDEWGISVDVVRPLDEAGG